MPSVESFENALINKLILNITPLLTVSSLRKKESIRSFIHRLDESSLQYLLG